MSGGVTSAVACKLAMDLYGKENCRFVFIDTKNEHEDTYRFLNDFCIFLGVKMEIISGFSDDTKSIEDIWYRYKSLNVAHGAVCSSTLKRRVREKWQKENEFTYQVFGFDINETKRARNMTLNNPDVNPIYPLLLFGYSKLKCFKLLKEWGIARPKMYDYGFDNNNCYGTGCVQGGQKYWLKWYEHDREKFNKMAEHEHKLTDLKGEPVTCLRESKNKSNGQTRPNLFLLPHPDYPHLKSLLDLKSDEIEDAENMTECNGFCGINSPTEETKKDFNNQLRLL